MGGVGAGFATTWEKRTPREDGGGFYAGVREGKDGSPPPSSRGQAIREDTGGCTPILTFPPEGGRERGEGEGRFPNCPYGKRGTEGMTREAGGEREGKDGSPPPSSRGQAIREDTGGCTPILTFPPEGGRERGEGEGRGSSTGRGRFVFTRAGFARTGGCTHILTFPPEGGRERGEGEDAVPEPPSTGRGERRGCEGHRWEGEMVLGQAIREDAGGCTPILTFPPEGGRERGEGEGRFENRLYGARRG